MRIAPRVWVLFGLMLVAVAGLTAPGLPGTIGAYTWLGVFPGLAVARLLAPRAGALVRWTLGLALSPLVSALAGWGLIASGQPIETAARVVGLAGWVLFASSEARRAATDVQDPDGAPASRFAVGWIVACAVFVALPALANAWILVRSDTWIHAALVREIERHGLPPQDPRFAGLPLNYVWIFNLFIALCDGLRGQDPFHFMAIFNVAGMVAWIGIAWQLAWMVWRREREARGVLVLLTLGLNAGAWLLWPLRLVRALRGEVTGWAEVQRQVANVKLGSTDVLYVLHAPFAWMVNSWDKWTIGTALGYAYVLMAAYLWSFARWATARDPRWLATAALTAAGMLFVHGVVGLSVIPVSLGALALAALVRPHAPWLPDVRQLSAFAGATLLGAAAAAPYTLAISRGWDASESGLRHHYLQFGWQMPWTLLTSLAVVFALIPAALRRVREERAGFATWLALWSFGMLLFSLVVHLPEGNESKFVMQLLLPLAALAGAGLPEALARLRSRLGAVLHAVLVGVLFVIPSILFLAGYVADPARHTEPALNPRPGEEALYRWIRTTSPGGAVFTDHRSRDLVMVRGERRLLAGTTFGPERAAFPLGELLQRRRRMADLYAMDPAAPVHADSLERTMQRLPGSRLFVLYRPEDWPASPEPWRRLEAAPDRFRLAYDRDGYRVYEFTP